MLSKFVDFETAFFKAKMHPDDQNDDPEKKYFFSKKCEIYFSVGTWRFDTFLFIFFHCTKK